MKFTGDLQGFEMLLTLFGLLILFKLLGRHGTITGHVADVEDAKVEKTTFRCVPSSLEQLLSLTRFTKNELKSLYRTFKNECPHGSVTEETFKAIYCQFFPNGDAETYAHYVFRAVDFHEEGCIDFEKFAVALSSLSRGTLAERLSWTFRLYDLNHDGYITKEEILSIVRSVYMLLGDCVSPPLSEQDYLDHSERVFHKLDRNGDGVVTLEEFYESCANDETIVQSMNVFDNTI